MQKANPNVERVEVERGSELVSLEQVSKSFSLPLSDAAEFLGVSTSALKTICYENGILRWPYRKFVGGETIEQIKRDAIAQKTKGLPTPPIQRYAAYLYKFIGGIFASGSGLIIVPSSTSSLQEPPPHPDEFKYGFPSDGLSTISFQWWEYSNCPQGTQQQSQILGKTGSIGGSGSQNQNNSSPTGSLSDLRNKAVKEGKAAFKLGVYKGHGIDKLDRNKRSTLIQIFKSSLPSQWEHGLS